MFLLIMMKKSLLLKNIPNSVLTGVEKPWTIYGQNGQKD